MRRVVVSLAALTLLLPCVPAAHADAASVPMMRLTATAEIAAPPAAVWASVTSGKNLVTWCPVWKEAKNSAVTLTRVGDVLEFTDQWGNGGRSIVTFLAKDKELRVAHEPNDGSYVCQARFTIAPSAKGSKVTWLEQYTDASSARDAEATAAKMQGEMAAALATLRKLAEGAAAHH